MRINAYILAADPTWIELNVLAYYDLVDRIVVSYDDQGRGWTGAAIDIDQCLGRLKAIDKSCKFEYRPGRFSRAEFFGDPMKNDTYQRQCALDQAATGADWVLQIDSDEVLPRAERLTSLLGEPWTQSVSAIEWPMRVLFRHIADTSYLEVCAQTGSDRYEYPGPIVVRPGARLIDARRAEGPFVRLAVEGDTESLQLRQPVEKGEFRRPCLRPADAIIHNSWARDSRSIRSKIASWSHNEGWKSWWFYYRYWKAAPLLWRHMRNFHPIHPPLWPALKIADLTAILSSSHVGAQA